MNPTFYKITVCQIITLFGNAALRFALPLYLLRRTDSAARQCHSAGPCADAAGHAGRGRAGRPLP